MPLGTQIPSGKTREHRVPLSDAAITLLRLIPRVDGDDVIFQSPRCGPLNDSALLGVCRRIGADCVPHGFRSTFRDWCAEHTNVSREVAEMALAHAIGNEVEAAYRRGDLFEKRRVLMDEWAAFCERDDHRLLGEMSPPSPPPRIELASPEVGLLRMEFR
jgi:integrase